jgi:hypothetical protein
VGKHDNRNSMKMKRRKAQVKKKSRIARQKLERKAAGANAPVKKPVAKKKAAALPVAPDEVAAPATTPAGAEPA